MEEVVQPEVGPLGFPVDREILFQALQGKGFRNIATDDPLHDVGSQEGQFAQAVNPGRSLPINCVAMELLIGK